MIDLTGQVFGRLTVIEEVPKPEGSNTRYKCWLCKCSCGNYKIVNSSNLRRGATKSCGCITGQYESCLYSSTNKRHNKYDLTGEYGICYASNNSELIIFDLEDYDKIKDYCWNVKKREYKNCTDKRAVSVKHDNGKVKYINMYDVIMSKDDPSMVIDHINRNPLDNRKANLRICTRQQNSFNKTGRSKYKGVYKNHKGKGWIAEIGYNYKHHYLGIFDTPEEAALAYNEKAKEFFGEFAYLNDVHFENEIKETI